MQLSPDFADFFAVCPRYSLSSDDWKPNGEKAMISDDVVETYRRDGVIVVPDVLDAEMLGCVRGVVDELVAASAEVATHTDVYDLEPNHTRFAPKVRRIRSPHKLHPIFLEIARNEQILGILRALMGPCGVRLIGSKLNMKSAHYGAAVEWHQDWAFYPHTNDNLLAIGVLLDDTDMSNGPLMVTPGTHTGQVWNHHGEDGHFAGLIDPDTIKDEIQRAVACTGRAGSVSFHHVRALHGSAPNMSDKSRNLLLYEVAASDAWPLMGLGSINYDEFKSVMLTGEVVEPRLDPVPVRMPLPPANRQGTIYEVQSNAKKSYFQKVY